MPLQFSKKTPSDSEAQCLDCGKIISRRADMNRHRKNKHPDGTETKFSCPWFGCGYTTPQKGNLRSHIDARHSSVPKYPCPECDRRFTDAAARIRHRKKMHGYVPHHTKEYLARQALNRKESVDEGASKAVENQGHQWGVHAAPEGVLNASSSGLPLEAPKLPEVAYHDDFWKMFVDVAHSNVPKPQFSQDVPISLPFPTMPGYDAPNAIQSSTQPQPSLIPSHFTTDYLGLLPPQLDTLNAIQHFPIQSTAQLQPSLSSDFTIDHSDLLGPIPDVMPSQDQAFGELYTEDYGIPPYNGLWNWLPQY